MHEEHGSSSKKEKEQVQREERPGLIEKINKGQKSRKDKEPLSSTNSLSHTYLIPTGDFVFLLANSKQK